MRQIDYHKESQKIISFLQDYLKQSGFKRYILGVSGGVDSALSLALAVKAIGSDNVFGILLPYKGSHPDSQSDAELLCRKLGVRYETRNITPFVDSWYEDMGFAPLRMGNWMARIRMNILFDLAAKYEALVLGTTNQSEWMTGYFTQFGDSACAVEPIGQLYKTEVWEMSRFLEIPQRIVDKIPTADLWQGQFDEEELGINYQELDDILYAISIGDDLKTFKPEKVKQVQYLIKRSEFKRKFPPMPESPCS